MQITPRSFEPPPLPPPAVSPREHSSTQSGGLVPGSVAGKSTVAAAIAAGVTPGQLVDQQLAIELSKIRGRARNPTRTPELRHGDSHTGRERRSLFDNRKEIARAKSPVPKTACAPARRSSSKSNKIHSGAIGAASPTSPIYSDSDYSFETESDD